MARKYSSLTEYSLGHEFNEYCSINETYFRTVAEEFNIDIDRIYDICEEKHIPFFSNAVSYLNDLYEKSNPYIKSKIFYKFMHDFGCDFINFCLHISTETVNSIPEISDLLRIDERNPTYYNQLENTFERILGRFNNEGLLSNAYSENEIGSSNWTAKIIGQYVEKFLEAYNKLSKNVFFKFNEVVSNEYKLEFEKSNKIFNDFLEDSKEELSKPENISYYNLGGNNVRIIQSSTPGFEDFAGIETEGQKADRLAYELLTDPVVRYTIESTSNLTTVTGFIGTTIGYSTYTPTYTQPNITYSLTQGATGSCQVRIVSNKTIIKDKLNNLKRTADKYKDAMILMRNQHLDPVLKKELTRFINLTPLKSIYPTGYKRFKKSLRTLQKFIEPSLINKMINDYTEHELSTVRGAIIEGDIFNWEIKVSKKSCLKYSEEINFRAIPYMFYVLTKDNIRIASLCIVYPGTTILDQVLSNILNIKTGKEIYILKNSGITVNSKTLYDLLVKPLVKEESDPELHNLNRLRNAFRNSKAMTQEFRVKVSSNIRDSVIRLINSYLPEQYMEYSMNLDVSWGEAIDYVAFNLFNVTVFDDLVRPMTWSTIPKERYLISNNAPIKSIEMLA